MYQSNEDAFANVAAQQLAQLGAHPTYDKEQFALFVKNDLGIVTQRINLSTFYHQYCESTSIEERNSVFAHIVSMHQRSLEREMPTFDAARDRIYPHIKDMWAVEQLNLEMRLGKWGEFAEEAWIPCCDIAGSFALTLEHDKPDTRELVTSLNIDRWGVDFNQLVLESVERLALRTHFAFYATDLNESGSKLYQSSWNDGYDAARIMMASAFDFLKVMGQHIFVMPNSETFLITGSEDHLGLFVAASYAESAQDEPKPLPPIPLMLDEERGFMEAIIPPNDPAHKVFAQLKLQYFDRIYAAQKELLKQFPEVLSDERYVSSFMPFQDDHGNLSSESTITEGVPTWLPKTDRIAFVKIRNGEAELQAVGAWDTIEKICPDLLQPCEVTSYPPRFEVNNFPTNFQIARINQSY